MSEYEPVISDSTKDIEGFDIEKQLDNDKKLNDKKSYPKDKICRERILFSLLILTFILFIFNHCFEYGIDILNNYEFQNNYEFLNSTRRNLRIGRGHHHHTDTCIERLEKEETSCCSEDLRCYGFNFNDHQIEKNQNLLYYSNLHYENEEHNYCSGYKKYKIIEMIFKFNYWEGNKNYINNMEYDYYYYNLDTINTIVNTTKCNEDSHLGCCQIKNTCENRVYNLAILNENNNCPTIKDLIQFDKIGYKKENNHNDLIFLLIMIIILYCLRLNAN